LAVLLAIGLIAGAVGAEAVYAAREIIRVPPERLGMPPRPPAIERQMLLAALASHAIAFGALGFLVCGSLGLGLAWLRKSSSVRRALFVGAILGFVFGAGGGAAALLMYNALEGVAMDGLFKAALIHLPNWLLIGIAMGVTNGVALRGEPRKKGQWLISALSAGAMAAILYPFLALVVFPAASPDIPIPFNRGLRILCFAFGGEIFGLSAARSLKVTRPLEPDSK
jgi:hypothetical protein